MKKLLYGFNWSMFIVLIMALSSLDNPSWMPTILVVASALMLVVGAYILEQIKISGGE